MTKDNLKDKTPKTEHAVYGVVWYIPDSPEEFKLDWFLTLNSLMFFAGKLQKRLSDHQVICFEKVFPTLGMDNMVTKKMRKAYLEGDFTLIKKTPAEHFKDQKSFLRRKSK